jgi:hypothetical protein
MDDLTAVVREAGGAAAVRDCGRVAIGPFQVTALAWRLDSPIERVSTRPTVPGTLFRAAPRPRTISGAPPAATPRGFKSVARTQAWQALSTCS